MAILGQIHIAIITLFFDITSGIVCQVVIPHPPWPIFLSFVSGRLRRELSNLKHSSLSYAMISKFPPIVLRSVTTRHRKTFTLLSLSTLCLIPYHHCVGFYQLLTLIKVSIYTERMIVGYNLVASASRPHVVLREIPHHVMRHTRSSGDISIRALGHGDAFESLMKFTYIKYLAIIYCLQTISISDALPTSCEHLLELDSIFPDDYYWITIISPENGMWMGSTIIYCHGMSSAEPKTFLPLPAGRKTNYASMSNLKSSSGYYCNFDLTYPEHGYTEFDMVRIVLANLLQASIYKSDGQLFISKSLVCYQDGQVVHASRGICPNGV